MYGSTDEMFSRHVHRCLCFLWINDVSVICGKRLRTDVRDTFIIPKKPMFIMFFRSCAGHQVSGTALVIYVYDNAFWDICTYIYASIVTMKCPYNKPADNYTPHP